MNTHDIEPMKYGGKHSDDYVTGWNDCYAAIEADRQRRGEPRETPEYTYHEHASNPGYGWIEPIMDADCPLIESSIALAICDALNRRRGEPVAWVKVANRNAAEPVFTLADPKGILKSGYRPLGYLDAPQPAEPHPPSRHCMCDDCAPSFERDDDEPVKVPSDELVAVIKNALVARALDCQDDAELVEDAKCIAEHVIALLDRYGGGTP